VCSRLCVHSCMFCGGILLLIRRRRTVQVLHYTLRRHVRGTQLTPVELQAAYLSPPLLILNNFNERGGEHMALVDTLFRGMFPPLNVASVKLSECRRAVLLHRMPDETVEMRHYAIRAAPRAASRPVKMLLASRVPDLGHLNDIADAIGGGAGAPSDSEADEEASTVELAQKFVGRGNVKSMQRSCVFVCVCVCCCMHWSGHVVCACSLRWCAHVCV
jgi:ribosome biogenesis protein SSF1/2